MADHVFAFERLSDAMTAPLVGEIVRVPSAFDTEVTAPEPAQLPSGSWKHPPARRIPFAKVEVAVPVWLSAATSIPPANVEVAVEVDVIVPNVPDPEVSDEKIPDGERKIEAKSEVVVALVVVELVAVRLEKIFVPENVLLSESSVDDAKVHVDVEKL